MASAAAPPMISGTPIDPSPSALPAYAQKLDASRLGGIAYRAFRRYSFGKVGLLANGTAYYLFLALFAILAFAYGVIAVVGADQLATALTDALNNAFPGVVGEEGIDPEQLKSSGTTAGIIGLALLLYSTLGAVSGASSSLHLIFGAPPDPRSFVSAKVRHLVILLCVAPLILVSFASAGAWSWLVDPILEALGLSSAGARTGLVIVSLAVGLLVDTLILWILLGHLGGVRPHPRPRLIASAIGAVGVGLIKALLDAIMSWALDKPQYGAFAAPIAVLLILQLLSLVLYVSACLAAGISDADVPLAELEPAIPGAPHDPAAAPPDSAPDGAPESPPERVA